MRRREVPAPAFRIRRLLIDHYRVRSIHTPVTLFLAASSGECIFVVVRVQHQLILKLEIYECFTVCCNVRHRVG